MKSLLILLSLFTLSACTQTVCLETGCEDVRIEGAPAPDAANTSADGVFITP